MAASLQVRSSQGLDGKLHHEPQALNLVCTPMDLTNTRTVSARDNRGTGVESPNSQTCREQYKDSVSVIRASSNSGIFLNHIVSKIHGNIVKEVEVISESSSSQPKVIGKLSLSALKSNIISKMQNAINVQHQETGMSDDVICLSDADKGKQSAVPTAESSILIDISNSPTKSTKRDASNGEPDIISLDSCNQKVHDPNKDELLPSSNNDDDIQEICDITDDDIHVVTSVEEGSVDDCVTPSDNLKETDLLHVPIPQSRNAGFRDTSKPRVSGRTGRTESIIKSEIVSSSDDEIELITLKRSKRKQVRKFSKESKVDPFKSRHTEEGSVKKRRGVPEKLFISPETTHDESTAIASDLEISLVLLRKELQAKISQVGSSESGVETSLPEGKVSVDALKVGLMQKLLPVNDTNEPQSTTSSSSIKGQISVNSLKRGLTEKLSTRMKSNVPTELTNVQETNKDVIVESKFLKQEVPAKDEEIKEVWSRNGRNIEDVASNTFTDGGPFLSLDSLKKNIRQKMSLAVPTTSDHLGGPTVEFMEEGGYEDEKQEELVVADRLSDGSSSDESDSSDAKISLKMLQNAIKAKIAKSSSSSEVRLKHEHSLSRKILKRAIMHRPKEQNFPNRLSWQSAGRNSSIPLNRDVLEKVQGRLLKVTLPFVSAALRTRCPPFRLKRLAGQVTNQSSRKVQSSQGASMNSVRNDDSERGVSDGDPMDSDVEQLFITRREVIAQKYENYVHIIIVPNEKKQNGLSFQALCQLRSEVNEAKKNPSCKLLLISSSGRYFCSGLDLGLLVGANKEQAIVLTAHAVRAFVKSLATFPKPIVAAVNGITVGLGVILLTYCDVVFSSEDATFCAPYCRLGYIPEGAGTLTLSQVIGVTLASEMLLRGRKLIASEALACGLVTEIFWSDMFLQEVSIRVQAMAKQSSEGMEVTKRSVRSQLWKKVEATLDREVTILSKQWMAPVCQRAMRVASNGIEYILSTSDDSQDPVAISEDLLNFPVDEGEEGMSS